MKRKAEDFDLSQLTDDELLAMNQLIIIELEERQRKRRSKALRAFDVGDRVYFDDPEGNRHYGIVKRVNQKTLTIITDQLGIWRVAPSFVKKDKKPERHGGKLFELKRPEQR